MQRLYLVLGMAFILSACGSPSDADIQAAIQQTEQARAAQASSTPAASSTPPPTNTPEPTPTPPVVKHTPSQVISAFKAAGLEAESPSAMKPKDYGMAPFVGEGVRFLIPSLCDDCGGRVIAVDDPDDRQRLFDYYMDLAKGSAMLFSWVFMHQNIVLQLNGDLPEETAMEYRTTLESIQ